MNNPSGPARAAQEGREPGGWIWLGWGSSAARKQSSSSSEGEISVAARPLASVALSWHALSNCQRGKHAV